MARVLGIRNRELSSDGNGVDRVHSRQARRSLATAACRCGSRGLYRMGSRNAGACYLRATALGEMLLDANDPLQAMREFEAALKVEPDRFWSLYGAARAAELAGDRAKAKALY